jgi:hypothetical protein
MELEMNMMNLPGMLFVKDLMLVGLLMNPEKTLQELQKYLDDNNLTFEEYMRANMITDEDGKYFDKIWMDAIYKNFGEDT